MLFQLLLCIVAFFIISVYGQLSSKQRATIGFNVTGFELPAQMVYTDDQNVSMQVPNISKSMDEAKTFVDNLVMQSVVNVLEQPGPNVFSSSILIPSILQQLDIDVTYQPLRCNTVFTVAPMNTHMFVASKERNCYIIDNIVTSLCVMGENSTMCMMNLAPVPEEFMTITGNLRTTNIIMANWSRPMWYDVLNRAAQSLPSSELGASFSSVSVELI